MNQDQSDLQIQSFSSKEDFLLADDNATAAIILVEKACEQYHKVFKKLDVPYSYVDFFLSEFSKYSALFTGKLKDFYSNCKTLNLTSEDFIQRYNKSFYSQHKSIKTNKEDKFLSFTNSIRPTFTNEMREVTNTNMSNLTENILNICKKIDSSDEQVSIVDLYEMFMIDRYILSHNFGEKVKVAKKDKTNIQAKKLASVENIKNTESSSKQSTTLIGNAIENKYQTHGKTVKIVIPKLKLPSSYPILETSRVDNKKHTRKLCSPAKQIIFLNKKKILAVKYSTGFLEKRKPVKKKKKFDWDF